MPDMKDILASVKAKKEAQRAADLAKWQDAIAAGVQACSDVRQADVVKASEASGLPVNLAWVPLNQVIPEGFALEAWVDSEGVLDVEVPRDLAYELAAWCEASGMRCGVEFGMEGVVLHVCIYEAPPTPEELNALTPPVVSEPVAIDLPDVPDNMPADERET